MTTIAHATVASATEAGHTVATEADLAALREADRDNHAADQAFSKALDARDPAATHEGVRNQVSFIKVHGAGRARGCPVGRDNGSWWTHLADQAHSPSP